MVAAKILVGGKRHKKHSKRKVAHKSVSVAKRYVKAGSKQVARDKMHKCGPKIKSGKHKGQCRVLLSKAGKKARAAQLARRKSHRKKK